ncbi:MAG: hypothetical protein ACRDOI_08760 [Trebonia sp.]
MQRPEANVPSLVRRASATPLVSRQALFEQAGIIATATLGELTCRGR